MQRKIKVIAIILFIATASIITLARPAFMNRYNADLYSKTALQGDCTICHVGYGGGRRNAFGQAFKDAGYQITPQLRAKFPDLFESKPTTRPAQPPEDLNNSKNQNRKHDDDDDREHDRKHRREHRMEREKEHHKEQHHEEHDDDDDDDD